jgi:hypothetical protein
MITSEIRSTRLSLQTRAAVEMAGREVVFADVARYLLSLRTAH